MIKNNHFAVAVVGMLLACFAAGAQPRGGAPGRVAPMAVSPARGFSPSGGPVSSGAHLARQGTVIRISPNGRMLSNAGSFGNPVNFTGGNAVPGLGFDYPHLAAIGGNFRGNPPVFGRGVHQHRNFTTPLFFGGFPYYSDYSDYSDNQQEQQQPQQSQQPQVIVIQPPAPAPVAPSPETIPEVAQPAAPPAPVREVGEFILVRRDGRVLFASVFSVTGTQVQYVTPEGIRRSLPLNELDTVATQEMNEARGTTLQFQN